MPLKQYEIRWANLPLPIGRRPVLLLTRTPAYAYLAKVIVAEVTTTVRGIPQEGSGHGGRFRGNVGRAPLLIERLAGRGQRLHSLVGMMQIKGSRM